VDFAFEDENDFDYEPDLGVVEGADQDEDDAVDMVDVFPRGGDCVFLSKLLSCFSSVFACFCLLLPVFYDSCRGMYTLQLLDFRQRIVLFMVLRSVITSCLTVYAMVLFTGCCIYNLI
jgi:hypothetical protein